MRDESTISSTSLGRAREDVAASPRPHLIVLMMGDDPRAPSSRHSLDGVDEVRFGRGPRHVARERIGRREVLTLHLPDARMSSEHGRFVRDDKAWVLDDPTSKNGAVVDGVIARRAVLREGAMVELGHTCFLLQSMLVEDAERDVTEGALAAPHAAFATFDVELARKFAALARVAATRIPVVLLGETGTGKEVVARAIHELSGRRGAFVGVNCGALPAALVEAELFGSRRGAFSGAIQDRPGLVRSADGGTLLLDEIGELPAGSQAAFLRVLQEHEVMPVGADRAVAVDLRVCAATLRDLDALGAEGAFRQDLYARLAGFTVELPPLRNRRADLGLLVRRLLARLGAPAQLRFQPEALRALLLHGWPLNIRELEQALGAALALSDDGVIAHVHLPESVRGARAVAAPSAAARTDPGEDDALKRKLTGLLVEHGGNVRAVASALGCQRTQVYRWIERYALRLEDFRR